MSRKPKKLVDYFLVDDLGSIQIRWKLPNKSAMTKVLMLAGGNRVIDNSRLEQLGAKAGESEKIEFRLSELQDASTALQFAYALQQLDD